LEDNKLNYHGLEENKAALFQVLGKSKGVVRWFTQDLEYLISDNQECYQLVLNFCKNNPNARFEILLHDPKALASIGHRLITLSQRLTTAIKIKHTHQEYVKNTPSAFVVVDSRHVYWKPIATAWDGQLKMDSPLLAKTWDTLFKEAWEQSTFDSQLRSLNI